MAEDLIQTMISRGIDTAKRNQSSYKYWLRFDSCQVLYWHILDESNRFAIIYVPLFTKLIFGPNAWSDFIEYIEAKLNEASLSTTTAWINETRTVA